MVFRFPRAQFSRVNKNGKEELFRGKNEMSAAAEQCLSLLKGTRQVLLFVFRHFFSFVPHCTYALKPWNVTTFPLDVQQLLFFLFYFRFENGAQKKLVHHNFEWVTPRWLDICRAALAVLKANHVTTGKEMNIVRQTIEWLFLFCSRRFYAPVITLWIVALQLIFLQSTLSWFMRWHKVEIVW